MTVTGLITSSYTGKHSEIKRACPCASCYKKGKGYPPAERDPASFHGIPPFDVKTGQPLKKSAIPTYTQIFSQSLIKIAERNDKIVAISAAMPEGTGLNCFADRFP